MYNMREILVHFIHYTDVLHALDLMNRSLESLDTKTVFPPTKERWIKEGGEWHRLRSANISIDGQRLLSIS